MDLSAFTSARAVVVADLHLADGTHLLDVPALFAHGFVFVRTQGADGATRIDSLPAHQVVRAEGITDRLQLEW